MSNLLKAQGVPLIDLDVLAREAVAPNSYALSALVSHFGPEILNPSDQSLNRDKLGSIVFNDEKQRRVLNSIVHPAVRRLLAWQLLKCWMRGERLAVVDAPLLIEAGLWKFCGAIVVVYWSVSGVRQSVSSLADHRTTLSDPGAPARKLCNCNDFKLATTSQLKTLDLGSRLKTPCRRNSCTQITSLTIQELNTNSRLKLNASYTS